MRKFVTGGGFPERAPKARGPTPLDPYRDYIEERIVQGCRFPELIWQELKQRGYLGSRASVQSCVVRLLFPLGKTPLVLEPIRMMPIPSARRVFGWLVGWRNLAVEEPRSADHERFVQALCKIEPVVGEVLSRAGVSGAHAPAKGATFRSMVETFVVLRRCGNASVRAKLARRLTGCAGGIQAAMEQWPDRGSCQPAQAPQAPNVWPREYRASAAAGVEAKLSRSALSYWTR